MRYNDVLTQKISNIVDGYLDLKPSTSGYVRGDCPYCLGHFCFGVHYEKGKTNCFRCDEGKTSLVNLVKFLIKANTYQETISYIRGFDDYGMVFRPKSNDKPEDVKPIELPEDYHIITSGSNIYARSARNYLKGRGFKLSLLEDLGIGYCDGGPYEGYIILPYLENGLLVYFTSRRYLGNGPKFNNPPKSIYGIGKEELIYNVDSLFLYRKVYLFESATNVITMGNNAVAFGGKAISPIQLDLLIKSPVERLVIGLDPDALDKAYKLALDLCEYKEIKVLELPPGTDVNSLGKKATKEIEKATKCMVQQKLRKKLYEFK